VILHVASAIGRARTELAAFDQALIGVGAANFNLVRLSSVIPPGSDVVESPRCRHPEGSEWGDPPLVLCSFRHESSPNSLRQRAPWTYRDSSVRERTPSLR